MLLLEMIVILIVIILRVNGFFKQVLWDDELLKPFPKKTTVSEVESNGGSSSSHCTFPGEELVIKILGLPLTETSPYPSQIVPFSLGSDFFFLKR